MPIELLESSEKRFTKKKKKVFATLNVPAEEQFINHHKKPV